MKNAKILIETLEICGKLIQKCSQTLKEYEAQMEKYEKSQKEMFEIIERQEEQNNLLQEKVDKILRGAVENARAECDV